jgi:predicted metal-dependent hydrolase
MSGSKPVTTEEKFRILDAFARVLVRRHLGPAWRVRWGKALTSYGSCTPATKVITLSRPLSMRCGIPDFRDTVLHEIAHGLAPNTGHGKKWKKVCEHLKCLPKAKGRG